MPKYYITIYSKNKIVLQKFLMFLQKKLSILNLQLVLKYNKKEKIKKKIAILKSPHINKTAQEQYEHVVYSYTIKTHSFRIQKYILFLKKLRNNLFPNMKTKIKIVIKKKAFNIEANCFKITNYKLNLITINKIQKWNSKKYKRKNGYINSKTYLNLMEKTSNYLRIIDCAGEFEINKKQPHVLTILEKICLELGILHNIK